jgi:beta-lactam-binding protein with PASTA domain/tRNA A-37 threonylcarbamoyl transferase component Bud32
VAPLRTDEQVGRVLDGRYRLTRLLGTGTSAHVYVADDVRLRRRVAIKVLHPALADDPSFLRRFRAEAQVVAALRHPHIMRVYDWGEDDGSAFLVLELLEGGTLRSLLDTGYLLPPAQLLRLGIEAAGALDHAHRRGLVHRDVKPANLLFDEESRVSVADFGLARALAESTWTEPAGAVVGTARYAAPEQVRGSALDARADVYALALVLVEAGTGGVPFATDTTLGTLMARVERPLEVGDDLGPLGAVIERAGRVEPSERLDAAGLVRALTELAERQPPPGPLPLVGVAHRHGVERDDSPTEIPAAGAEDPVVDWDDDGGTTDDRTMLQPAGVGAGSADLPPSGGRRRRPSRRAAAVAAAVIVVAGGGAAGAVVATRPPPRHPVPALTGDTEAAATAALHRLHLRLQVTGRGFDPKAPVGTVLAQRPATGRVAEGSAVDVTLSAGPKPVAVPALAGKAQSDATAAITAAGLQVGAITYTPSTSVAKGDVISSSPDKGALLPGQPVALVISSGPPTVDVPALSGYNAGSYSAASGALTHLGLLTRENEEYSNTVPAGEVISTYPGAGFAAPVGSTIVVNVSLGPQTVSVPGVAGESVTSASGTLAAAGLSVSGVSGNPTANVTGTTPAAGTRVRLGTAVQLTTG